VAPEILKNHPHDESVDMWSVGVIMYVLLVGYPPFMEENQKVLFRKIRMGTYEFYEEDWSDISSSAKELIQSLLVVDPIHRMTVGEALRHPWILHEDDEMLSRNSLMGSLGEIRKYMEIAQVSDDPNAMNWVAENHGVFT
jgi:serine/threonine protein kinase